MQEMFNNSVKSAIYETAVEFAKQKLPLNNGG